MLFRSLKLNSDVYEDLVNQVTLKVTEEIRLNTSTVKIMKFREELLKRGVEVIDVKLDLMSIRDYFTPKSIRDSNESYN